MDRSTFLAASAALASTPALAQKKEVVKIVSSLPRTGSARGQTDTIANAIVLAIADFAKDYPFEVKYLDLDDATAAQGAWDAGQEADNARQAVADKDVVAFIGPYNSGAARVSMPILNEAGLVQVSPSATWPGLTVPTPDPKSGEPEIYRPAKQVTFCRVCPRDDTQGPLAAAFVANTLKARSVYVVDDGELYGSMVAGTFAAKCKDLKIKILGHEHLDPRARNYKAVAERIKDKDPDAVYFGGTSQSGGPQLAIDLARGEVNRPLVVPDGCYEEAFIKAAGAEVLNGRCYATIGGLDPSGLKGAEFVKRYKARYMADPEAYAIYGYEAAAVVLAALAVVAKKDRAAVRKAVLATKDFDKGVFGKWSFDANGDTTLEQLTVSKIEKGKFIPLMVIDSRK
ncbi:branched-chain amino acid ABC transporter substrate-binding protein [Gemmata sp.]|uniref:branched-chain amino acid ABC transporter substrate-binding protein n=1 Tax=Gemmata sp. TaxID=1914242 RepID=UPI003F6EEB26